MARKRASMREGPLAELFRATEAAQRQESDDEPADEPLPPAAAADDQQTLIQEPSAVAPAAARPKRRRHEEVALEETVEHVHDFAIDILQAVAAIDQHQRAFQHLPPAQIVVDQEAPFLDNVLGRFGKAIARHVDQPKGQRIANIEEIQLLRPPRRVRRARKAAAIGQRIEQ